METADVEEHAPAGELFEIRFPGREQGSDGPDQNEEWCEVRIEGELRRIRFHDYDEIYAIPGLYEQLFYTELECVSPRVVCSMLAEAAGSDRAALEQLRILDVGAGNGMVGEELKRLGVGSVVGIDIIDEAAEAAERDRPGVYDDYVIADLTDLGEGPQRALAEAEFNGLTCVAALGFDDIPPAVFTAAYDFVAKGGLIGLCIKDEFVGEEDRSGFSHLIRSALDDGTLARRAEHRYRHRLSATGEPLEYVAMIAEKRGDLPAPRPTADHG